MQNSKKSSEKSRSGNSLASSHHHPISANSRNHIRPSSSSDYEYIGRLVTHERPIVRRSNTHSYHQSRGAIYEDDSSSSDDSEYGMIKKLGVIKINDRHVREIYRVPTPPPQYKTVVHRLRSPKPKIIERVFVRRPSPEIIENIIQIPPQKVRFITREKYLSKSKPIIRTKVVHLPSRQDYRIEEHQPPMLATSVQTYSRPVSYTQSSAAPNTMFQAQHLSNPQAVQATCYSYNHH